VIAYLLFKKTENRPPYERSNAALPKKTNAAFRNRTWRCNGSVTLKNRTCGQHLNAIRQATRFYTLWAGSDQVTQNGLASQPDCEFFLF
jgi:hypothetical protein